MYILQSSQGQSSGVHDLMSTFKASRLTDPLRCSGNIVFQTIGPNVLNDLSPHFKDLDFSTANLSPALVSLPLPTCLNTSDINGGDNPF